MKIAELFHKRPIQWGLRGDPHLWAEMIPIKNQEEMRKQLRESAKVGLSSKMEIATMYKWEK